MKLKAIAVFVIVVLGASNSDSHQQRLSTNARDGFSYDRTVLAAEIMEITDPVDLSLPAGVEPPFSRSIYPIALAVPAVFLAGFWLYCLLRAAQTARVCLLVCRTRPWFIWPRIAPGRGILLVLILCAWQAQAAFSDTYFTYSVSTGSSSYSVGDSVHWSISAGVEGDHDGIAGLSVSLYESMSESMEGPYTEFIWHVGKSKFYLTYVEESYFTTGTGLHSFNIHEGFTASEGSSGGGGVTGIGVDQFEKKTGFSGGSLCEGVYDLTMAGFHVLDVNHGSGYVWISGQDDTEEVGQNDSSAAAFYVTSTPVTISANLSLLDPIAANFYQIGCDNSNLWCDGADTNMDGEVNTLDIGELFEVAGDAVNIEQDMYNLSVPVDPGNVGNPTVFNPVINSPILSGKLKRDIYLSADDGVNGIELWRIGNDGDLELFDIREGSDSSSPTLYTETSDALYFVANTDDENVGLYEMFTGDDPLLVVEKIGKDAKDISLTYFDGEFYFTKITDGNVRELWRIDGDTGEIKKVFDIGTSYSGQKSFVTFNGEMYFTVLDNSGFSVKKTDGVSLETIASTGQKAPSSFTVAENFLFFIAKTSSIDADLYVSDGTASGTKKTISNISIITLGDVPFATHGNSIYFVTTSGSYGFYLKKFNGETKVIKEIQGFDLNVFPSLPYDVKVKKDKIYVSVIIFDGSNETEIWAGDAASGNIYPIKRLEAGDEGYSFVEDTVFLNSSVYMRVNNSLWNIKDEIAIEVPETKDVPITSLKRLGDKLLLAEDKGNLGSAIWVYGPEINLNNHKN